MRSAGETKKIDRVHYLLAGFHLNSLGPILLKLCGSLIDVRFMMETACEKLKLECVFAEERLNPLDLLKNSINSTVILSFISDEVSMILGHSVDSHTGQRVVELSESPVGNFLYI